MISLDEDALEEPEYDEDEMYDVFEDQQLDLS